jgi:hypothetical protein
LKSAWKVCNTLSFYDQKNIWIIFVPVRIFAFAALFEKLHSNAFGKLRLSIDFDDEWMNDVFFVVGMPFLVFGVVMAFNNTSVYLFHVNSFIKNRQRLKISNAAG